MATRLETKEAYDDGRAARMLNESITECPFGMAEMNLRSWWLAGWNDKDGELY